MSSSVSVTEPILFLICSTAIVAAGCNSSVFMVLPFVDGWCENPIVSRSGKATIQGAA